MKKIKTGTLVASIETVKGLLETNLPPKSVMAIRNFSKEVISQSDAFDAEKNKLIEKYGSKDEETGESSIVPGTDGHNKAVSILKEISLSEVEIKEGDINLKEFISHVGNFKFIDAVVLRSVDLFNRVEDKEINGTLERESTYPKLIDSLSGIRSGSIKFETSADIIAKIIYTVDSINDTVTKLEEERTKIMESFRPDDIDKDAEFVITKDSSNFEEVKEAMNLFDEKPVKLNFAKLTIDEVLNNVKEISPIVIDFLIGSEIAPEESISDGSEV